MATSPNTSNWCSIVRVAAADTDAAEAKGRVVLMVLAVLLKLSLAMAAALAVSKTLLPPLFRLMQRKVRQQQIAPRCAALLSSSRVRTAPARACWTSRRPFQRLHRSPDSIF